MGTLFGGGKSKNSIGERSLLGANAEFGFHSAMSALWRLVFT